MKRRKSGADERAGFKGSDGGAGFTTRQQLEVESVPAVEQEEGWARCSASESGSFDRGSGSGRPVEQLLHFGFRRRDTCEGQFRTRRQEIWEFFQGLAISRVVVEVGTHSAWVREVIAGFGHEVLVANPRRMEGSKRRRRKNDRIDANKLARLGRMDPKSLHPIQHRSTEIREDLLVLRARDALVESRTELINTVRGLVKTMGARVSSCSSEAFPRKRPRRFRTKYGKRCSRYCV